VIVFEGSNPWPDDDFLQKVASEFNLSETAFVRGDNNGSNSEFDLRWFTPTKEVR
jgi:predicted PhzF superfamily epimerase YddE/YHI9